MVMFKEFEKDMLVNGQTINSVVDAFANIKFIVDKFFIQSGLPKASEIELKNWYPQQKWLDAFKLISEKVGPYTLTNIGKKIPENSQLPPEIDTIEKSLASIDIAYHMNHKNSKGQILFDQGQMYEGIGHYYYSKIPNAKKAIIRCESPYPCDFDKGIITAMALKFNKDAKILHDDLQDCRKNGKESCTFIVQWKGMLL